MIQIVVLSVFFGSAFSTCPVMRQSYEDGTKKASVLQMRDNEIAENGPLIRHDDIGNIFFSQPEYPSDANDDFIRTTTLLISQQLLCSSMQNATNKAIREVLLNHTDCLPLDQRCSTMEIESCPKDSRYRSITGACNNLKHPKWGKAFTRYGRLQPPSYNDGIFEMRKSIVNKRDLPGARVIANRVIKRSPFTCKTRFQANHGAVMYGQLMAHDHGMRQMHQTKAGGMTRNCCKNDYSGPLSSQPYACHAIEYSKNDPYLNIIVPGSNIQCMNYIRSQMTFPNDCNLSPAGAVNLVTHHLDLSTVYGSAPDVINKLRAFKKGLLKTNANNVFPEDCDDPEKECYITGDFRATAFFTLGVLQSIYHRLHNIIASELASLNPKWEDERIFQEARRINIAIHQHAVYTEWLPLFLDDESTASFRPIGNQYLGKYSSNVDASATAEFSHCAFRIYHANLADHFSLIDADYTVSKNMSLDECDAGLKILETKFDNVVRGLFMIPAAESTVSAKVRNQMFNNDNKFNLGIDLISHDLLSGRDNGVQPYYVYFELCTKKRVRSWNDLLDTISAESVNDLKSVYASVYDVDTYVALALEKRCGTYLGKVGRCIIRMQYERSRAGDRYFYSLPNGAYPFTKAQLGFIYNFKYANVLCATTHMREAPSRSFEVPSESNPMIQCKRGINLRAWKETIA